LARHHRLIDGVAEDRWRDLPASGTINAVRIDEEFPRNIGRMGEFWIGHKLILLALRSGPFASVEFIVLT
jgi:hypothetical protein